MTNINVGIDIGTTSIKVCVKYGPKTIASSRRIHNAYQKTFVGKDCANGKRLREQDPKVLLQTLDDCFEELKIDFKIKSISVTGQMHGVVLWTPKETIDLNVSGFSSIIDNSIEINSNLITWEDQRCDESFLSSLPKSTSLPVATGYGLASLLWLNHKNMINPFTLSGTIMDFIVWLLTQTKRVQMTSHNAKSWGYFSDDDMSWEDDLLKGHGFDCSILPSLVPVCQSVGTSMFSCYGITKNETVVYGGLGDMQCSIRSCNSQANEAVLNIGTSSQLSFIIDKANLKDTNTFKDLHPALDIVPYLHDKIIITAASLTGGNVIRQFTSTLRSWAAQIGCQNIPGDNTLFSILNNLLFLPNTTDQTGPVIVPRIYGERHSPQATASVANITSTNLTLTSTIRALYKGIAENLLHMMPLDLIAHHGKQRIVGTGGTLISNEFLQTCVKETFRLPIRIADDCDAAEGAVMFCSQ